MAKEKIFRPEDFDKAPKKLKTNYSKWAIVAIIIIIIIVIMFFMLRGDNSDTQSQNLNSIQQVVGVNYNSTTDASIAIESKPINTNIAHSVESSSNEDVVGTENQTLKAEIEKTQYSTNRMNVTFDVDDEAIKVIRGDYGVGQIRKDKLGVRYQTIQSRVNEMKRKGIF